MENAIKTQEIRIEMVDLEIVKRVLRAPADGRVVEICCLAGEVVAAGETVLSILEPRPTELVAYVPEHRVLDLKPGDEVKIRRVADPGRAFVSSIVSLGSSVERKPQRQEPSGLDPGWGIAVFIPLPVSLEIKPGEAFEISF